MRKESKWFRRSLVLLALLTVFAAQGAVAADRETGRSLGDRFEQAKRFIVVIFSRIGWPPG